MRDLFFDQAECRRRANGVLVIVLQSKPKTRGGKPEPVKIITCRDAGAHVLIEALRRELRNNQ